MNCLPFQNNSVDVAAQIARRAHIHRQRGIAVMSNGEITQPPPLPLVLAAGENPNTAQFTGIVIAAESTVRIDAFPPPGNPPKLADFLLTVLARSKYSRAAVGCINERFADECITWRRARSFALLRRNCAIYLAYG